MCPHAHCLVSIPCAQNCVSMCTWPCINVVMYPRTSGCVYTCRIGLYICYVHVVIYLCAHDYVSMCMWTWILVHVAIYSHSCGHVSTNMWQYIHEVMYSYTSFCVSTYRIWLCAMCTSRVTMCKWLCIHVLRAMDPHACGHVSTWTWPCIHMHMVMYSPGHEPMCTWQCIHV